VCRACVREVVVVVQVGTKLVRYYVHSLLLIERSEYFQEALNQTWKGADTRTLCLDDVDCSICEYESIRNQGAPY
jgi:hypothetical protein